MSGFISYLRTAAEIKSLLGLGVEKVIEMLKSEKLKVRLQVFMRFFLMEKKNNKQYLKQLNQRLLEWQASRDNEQHMSAVLVYHHTGARALHGFRYQLIEYQKKDRAVYKSERSKFSRNIRIQWLKKIADSHYGELKQAGLSDRQIFMMRTEGGIPFGYQVHHRIPLDDGGTNDFDNLILIRDNVEHRSIHGYYNPGELQIKLMIDGETKQVTLPVPPENAIVYPNPESGFFCDRIPNSTLVELYDVDRNIN
jgi:hypothetical protein